MAPSQSSPLLNCPADLIPFFLEPLSREDLFAVCLVCRDLRPFAEPFLYSSIDWIWLKDEVPPIGKLLRTILRRPELAAHIRRVVLAGATFYRSHPRNIPEKITVSEVERGLSIGLVEQIKVPRSNEWIQGLRDGAMGAYVAVLLSQLTNLTYLEIGPNFGRNTRFLGIFLRSALCETSDSGLPAFRHLREVRYNLPGPSGFRGKTEKNTLDIVPFFYLPEAEHISATVENPAPNDFAWPAQWRPSPSNLTSLDLSHIREGDLGRILSTTPALSTLRWECVHQEDGSKAKMIDLDQIAEDLCHVRGTLQDLTITAQFYLDPSSLLDPDFTINGSLRAISDFPQIVNVAIPLMFLVGLAPPARHPLGHILPRNVELVTIRDDLFCSIYDWQDFEILAELRSWLTDWKTWTPRLRHFHLYVEETDEQWYPPIRENLRELCAGVEVSFEVTKLRAGYSPTPSP